MLKTVIFLTTLNESAWRDMLYDTRFDSLHPESKNIITNIAITTIIATAIIGIVFFIRLLLLNFGLSHLFPALPTLSDNRI